MKIPVFAHRWLLIAGIILLALAVYLWLQFQPEATRYVTAPADRGDVVRAIVATGTVNPVTTVQVGTYVSGTIQKLSCDYNTQVKAGQSCAKIDPRPYQVIVDQDTANLSSARAQLKKDQAGLVYAKVNYQRDAGLQKRGVVSKDVVDNDKSALDQAAAQVKMDEAQIQERQAALDAAKVNLGYTDIVSPVDGVVISRSIDVGQTVAASFQTPTLFLIAKDLTKMQVDTNVSESDVGGAQLGQKASFTVEAYPDKTFWGQVTQVRQSPITVQNVVTYNVVVSVDNTELQLLPGMTANARIISDQRDDVLRVPLQALRYSPQGAHEKRSGGSGGDGSSRNRKPAVEKTDKSETQGKEGRVWVSTSGGRPQPVAVTQGLSDGTYVEITGGDLKEGDKVVVNEIRAGSTPPKASAPGGGASPLQQRIRF